MKELENIPVRRFLRPLNNRNNNNNNNNKIELNEGEYARVNNMILKMARKQKKLLYIIYKLINNLSDNYNEEKLILEKCFNNANNNNLFNISKLNKNNSKWLEDFMDIFTPWAQYYEDMNNGYDDIYFLDNFWIKFSQSDCLGIMLQITILIQDLEILDGQLLRFLKPYNIQLLSNCFYSFNISDDILKNNIWINDLVFAEQLFDTNSIFNNVLETAVAQEKLSTSSIKNSK